MNLLRFCVKKSNLLSSLLFLLSTRVHCHYKRFVSLIVVTVASSTLLLHVLNIIKVFKDLI